MKTRQGFVSNSSSTSYIVVIPDGFKLKKNSQIIDILWSALVKTEYLNDWYLGEHVGAENEEETEEETDKNYSAFSEIEKALRPYCVAQVETGADSGNSIVLLNNKKIKKLMEV